MHGFILVLSVAFCLSIYSTSVVLWAEQNLSGKYSELVNLPEMTCQSTSVSLSQWVWFPDENHSLCHGGHLCDLHIFQTENWTFFHYSLNDFGTLAWVVRWGEEFLLSDNLNLGMVAFAFWHGWSKAGQRLEYGKIKLKRYTLTILTFSLYIYHSISGLKKIQKWILFLWNQRLANVHSLNSWAFWFLKKFNESVATNDIFSD